MKFLCVLSIFVLSLLGCGHVNASGQDKIEIRKLIEDTYTSNVRSGSGKWYSSVFSKDALWMPPKSQDRHGREDIAIGLKMWHKGSRLNQL